MEQQQLNEFKDWFGNYVSQFYGDDEYINANLKLKEEHSLRVCQESRHLAEDLHLSLDQRRLAETIGLFHDIGRFKQFIKYRTYNDVKSVNHCELALEVLSETNVLGELDSQQRQLIETAIKYHGMKDLPKDLNGDCLLFAKLIRDADKLDIYYVVTDLYSQYKDDQVESLLEIEFPDSDEYSPQLAADILAGKKIDYSSLRTLNDFKLLQLAWVYDVNFTATLKRIRQQKLLKALAGFLPVTDQIEQVKRKIFDFLASAIEKG